MKILKSHRDRLSSTKLLLSHLTREHDRLPVRGELHYLRESCREEIRELIYFIEILEDEISRLESQLGQLGFIKISFVRSTTMPPVQGPITLNQGDTAKTIVLYFDQTGQPMPSDFVPPPVAFTIDHPEFCSSVPEADQQTDDLAYVTAGVANLTATVQGPNGPLVDTETVTCNPVVVPPPVLSSVKIASTVIPAQSTPAPTVAGAVKVGGTK